MNTPQKSNVHPENGGDAVITVSIPKVAVKQVISLLDEHDIPYRYTKNIPTEKGTKKHKSIEIKARNTADYLNEIMQTLHDEITSHISVKIPTIETIAERFNISISKFKVEFKKKYEEPYYQHFIYYKLGQAKQLLESGEYSVKQISEMLGYTSVIKFIIIFKKYYQITPGKIKMQARMNQKP